VVLSEKCGLNLQVIDYYSKKGIVASLHAEKPPKEVTVEVEKVLSQ
jgi:adenylate kinase